MIKKIAFLPVSVALCFVLILPKSSFGARSLSKESFLPPNNLRIPVSVMSMGGISYVQFNQVIDEMESIYGPIVAAKGGVLIINRLWEDPTVNSDAEEINGEWIINSYGGLARDSHITQDGFALVACHEMGHHLGGAPKYGGSGDDWASNEGEADYFSTAKCLHRVFADSGSARFTRMSGIPGSQDEWDAVTACAKAYPHSNSNKTICVRSAMAGLSVTGLLAELSQDAPAHFNTPDTTVVAQTNDEHPASQCRLDTYFQGALCQKSYLINMSNSDPTVGACVLSQGAVIGLRPLCWYKPTSAELPPPSIVASSIIKSGALSSLQSAALWQ